MKKETYELIINTAKEIADKGHQEDTLEATVMLLVTPLCDIARQLTRIADKLDERWDFNKEADDLATEVNAQLERTPPTPDALVDRLAGLLRQAQGRIKGDAPLSNEVESALEIYRAGYQTAAPKTDDALVERLGWLLDYLRAGRDCMELDANFKWDASDLDKEIEATQITLDAHKQAGE